MRITTQLLPALIGLLALATLGCPARVVIPDSDPVAVATAGSDTVAQQRFAEAVALYEAGQFNEAADAFRLFGAEFAFDALALRAELYLGRSLAAASRYDEAERVLDSLSTAPEDADIAAMAALYLGFVYGVGGEFDASHTAVDRALSRRPGFTLDLAAGIPGDEALLASLLAEGRLRAGDAAGALSELERVAAFAPDDVLLNYAYDRAVEVAETRLGAGELAQVFATPSVFVRAVVATPHIAALVQGGDLGRAQDVLLEATPLMVDLGLTDRLAAAEAMASSGTAAAQPSYGVLLSLSGPGRRAGRAALGGILLAQRAFNQGSSRSVALIRDTYGDPEVTRAAVAELASLGVAAIIGPVESDLAEAAAEAAEHARVPLISLSTGPLRAGARDVYRLQIDAVAEAQVLVTEARSRGATRYVIVRGADVASDAYTERFADALADAVIDIGGDLAPDIAMSTTPDQIQASAAEAARAVVNSGANAVVLALDVDPASAMGAWLAAENLWAGTSTGRATDGRQLVVLGACSLAAGDNLIRNSSRYFENSVIPAWFLPETASGVGAEFAARFEVTYDRAAGVLDAVAYDAATLVRSLLLEQARTTPSRMAEGLDALRPTEGAIGSLSFDGTGNLTTAPRLATVRGGVFAPLNP